MRPRIECPAVGAIVSVKQIAQLREQWQRPIMIYFPDIDTAAHRHGPDSDAAAKRKSPETGRQAFSTSKWRILRCQRDATEPMYNGTQTDMANFW